MFSQMNVKQKFNTYGTIRNLTAAAIQAQLSPLNIGEKVLQLQEQNQLKSVC